VSLERQITIEAKLQIPNLRVHVDTLVMRIDTQSCPTYTVAKSIHVTLGATWRREPERNGPGLVGALEDIVLEPQVYGRHDIS
jgi:uncharacterized protein (DUF736 family)